MSKSEFLEAIDQAAQANGAPPGTNSVQCDIDLKNVYFNVNWNAKPPGNINMYAYSYDCVFNVAKSLVDPGTDYTVPANSNGVQVALPIGATALFVTLKSAKMGTPSPSGFTVVGVSYW